MALNQVNRLWFPLFILLSIFTISRSDDDGNCAYTVYVETGSEKGAETDSIISLALYDASGYGIAVNNLTAWGLMDPGHKYFGKRNLDIFSGRRPCLEGPIRKMKLTYHGSASGGSDPQHGWYVKHVRVITAAWLGKDCAQEEFRVEREISRGSSVVLPENKDKRGSKNHVAIGERSDDRSCVYTVYVRTGTEHRAGTESNISLTLYDAQEDKITIDDLKAEGRMGPGYNYFEKGNVDIFIVRDKCLRRPICKMSLASDGSGLHHAWYVDYVHVTTADDRKDCSQQKFKVEQWLATDRPPYERTAIRNNCTNKPVAVAVAVAIGERSKGSSVVAEI